MKNQAYKAYKSRKAQQIQSQQKFLATSSEQWKNNIGYVDQQQQAQRSEQQEIANSKFDHENEYKSHHQQTSTSDQIIVEFLTWAFSQKLNQNFTTVFSFESVSCSKCSIKLIDFQKEINKLNLFPQCISCKLIPIKQNLRLTYQLLLNILPKQQNSTRISKAFKDIQLFMDQVANKYIAQSRGKPDIHEKILEQNQKDTDYNLEPIKIKRKNTRSSTLVFNTQGNATWDQIHQKVAKQIFQKIQKKIEKKNGSIKTDNNLVVQMLYKKLILELIDYYRSSECNQKIDMKQRQQKIQYLEGTQIFL